MLSCRSIDIHVLTLERREIRETYSCHVQEAGSGAQLGARMLLEMLLETLEHRSVAGDAVAEAGAESGFLKMQGAPKR
ncbi:hypothetical protein NDU88_004777 [Pleurodeles waltl]|uniref:Uncharacterized protein n=1 Tax=Pleurodeles waltl TaxID=8319 RepID=A0AAV7RM90_PLEWA|nr:hypothetical protein NDU88_004777 [Pleurodeles waltl]